MIFAVFLGELILRVLAFRGKFVRSANHWLDAVVVAASVLEMLVMPYVSRNGKIMVGF